MTGVQTCALPICYTSDVTGQSALPATASYKYGATVTVAEEATAPGYTFSGWSTADATIEEGEESDTFTMPAKDVAISGSWTANTTTGYKVQHYLQDLEGEGYTLKETESLTGTTDTTATAVSKTYEGFTFDENNTNNVLSGNIAGDGSLILKVYYSREERKSTRLNSRHLSSER